MFSLANQICVMGVVVLVSIASTARADLSDCGNISLEAEAECTVIPPEANCEAKCTPISVRAACSAELAAQCEAGCDKLPSVECSGRCEADCQAECLVDPPKFDCEGACRADCAGQCEAECQAGSDRTGCMAQCSGACGVSCNGSCDADLPKADCKAQCKAGCDGSCKVDTNLDCQADCQAKGYAKCEADVQGGCKARCQTKEGALFCEGQFVDTSALDQCIAAIKAAFDAHVTYAAEGESSCEGASCEASGRARVSSDCSSTRPGAPANVWALFALVSAMLAYMFRLRNP